MKRLPLLGLCAVVAMAWAASVGTDSSSATVLCLKYQVTCPKEEHYPPGSEFHATLESGTSLKFSDTFGFGLDTCTESTIKGTTQNTGSATETIRFELETFTIGGCESSVVLENGELELHYVSGSSTEGTLTGEGQQITVEMFDADCVYGTLEGGSHMGKVTGTNPNTLALGKIHILGTLQSLGNPFCIADIRWSATYKVTYPEVFYVKSKRE